MRGYDCENATTYSRSQAALQHLHEYSLILRALRHMLSLAGSRACGERLTQPERVSRTSLLSMTLAGRAAASAHAAARGSSPADTHVCKFIYCTTYYKAVRTGEGGAGT